MILLKYLDTKSKKKAKKGDQNVIKKAIQNRNLIYKRHVSFREAFHNMSVSMLTIFSLFSCYFLTIFLSMLCFPMSPQSLFDCFVFSTCCTNTPTYVHYFLAEFLTPDRTKKHLHFQWLPVVARTDELDTPSQTSLYYLKLHTTRRSHRNRHLPGSVGQSVELTSQTSWRDRAGNPLRAQTFAHAAFFGDVQMKQGEKMGKANL